MSCKTLSRKAALAVGVLALVSFLSASARADECTVRDTKGFYAGTFTGFITAGPFAGPFAAVSRIACDGKGNCAGSGTQSLNGLIVPFVDNGHDPITVNPDCTGNITVNFPPESGIAPIHFNTIQSKDGKEFWSIQTDPGTAITGHLQLISRNPD